MEASPAVPDIYAQRVRSTRQIFVAAALGNTSVYSAFTVAPLVAIAHTGSRAWSGIPGAALVAGAAVGAAAVSTVMGRRGRRTGLQLGYSVGMIGAVGTLVAARTELFALLLPAMLLIGVGHASNQLARFVAADLQQPARRPAVLGWIVWAAMIGAVAGPTLPRPLAPVAKSLEVPPEAAGFFVAIVFYLGALGVALMLRPDPSVLAVEDATVGGLDRATTLWSLASLPHVRTALVAMLVAQTTMVLVMTMTPVHIREHGHGLATVGLVMSAHFVGMFALAPVAGRLVGRFSPPSVMMGGLIALVVATVGSGLTSGAHSRAAAMWLFGLGLGWSMTFVAGSAALTEGLPYRARVKVQGGVDALAWGAAAVASLSSGILLSWVGFDVLSFAGAGLGLLPVTYLATRRRATVLPTS